MFRLRRGHQVESNPCKNPAELPVPFKISFGLELFAIAFLLALNALYLHFFMLMRLDPQDHNAIADLGWRVYCGQKIYKDFIFHSGPVYPFTLAFCFRLFGFGKTAFWAHITLINSGAMMLCYFMFRRRIHALLGLLITASTMVGLYWNYPYPCYTQDAIFWGMPGLLALIKLTPLKNSRRALACGFICGFVAVVSFMTKSAVGGPYGIVFFAALLVSDMRIYSLSGFLAGILACLGIFGVLLGGLENYYLNSTIYLKTQKGRLSEFGNPFPYLHNFYWLPFLIMLSAIFPHYKKFAFWLTLFTGCAAIHIFTTITGSSRTLCHAFLLGCYLGIAFLMLRELGHLQTKPRALIMRKIAYGLLIFVACCQIGFSIFKYFELYAFQKYQKQKEFTHLYSGGAFHDYAIKAKPLAGWKCPVMWGESFDGVVRYINEKVPLRDSLLVFPPWQMVYPATGHESYRNIPFDIIYGSIPSPGRQRDQVRNSILSNPPDWIVAHHHFAAPQGILNDYTDYLRLDSWLLTEYRIEHTWEDLALFRRKK